MPEISSFLGIVIRMYYADHGPAHFHAEYGDYQVKVFIESGVVEGQFPRRALAHVVEWCAAHRQDLLDDWSLAVARKPLRPVPPLE
jgi:hypothetical protein